MSSGETPNYFTKNVMPFSRAPQPINQELDYHLFRHGVLLVSEIFQGFGPTMCTKYTRDLDESLDCTRGVHHTHSEHSSWFGSTRSSPPVSPIYPFPSHPQVPCSLPFLDSFFVPPLRLVDYVSLYVGDTLPPSGLHAHHPPRFCRQNV